MKQQVILTKLNHLLEHKWEKILSLLEKVENSQVLTNL